jgi:hypothetical protein
MIIFAEEGASFMYLQLAAGMWSSGETYAYSSKRKKGVTWDGQLEF